MITWAPSTSARAAADSGIPLLRKGYLAPSARPMITWRLPPTRPREPGRAERPGRPHTP